MATPEQAQDLPLTDNGTAQPGQRAARPVSGRRRLFLIPLVMVFLFSGAVIGMYFQPPALRAFFGVTGLEPGGGTSKPIATAVDKVITEEDIAALNAGAVVALGRLVPAGQVLTIAVPYRADGARVETLPVHVGQWVEAGGVLATLDNRSDLEAVLKAAEAEGAVAEAVLAQTRLALSASQAEAEAALKRAQAEAVVAGLELERARSLADRGVATQAVLDRAEANERQAQQEVQRLLATFARYQGGAELALADIHLAERRRDAANVAIETARQDLEKAIVRAPTDGMVLELHVRPGERPGTNGVLDFGNTRQMTAEIEVYQNQIERIALGNAVRLRSEAFAAALHGQVVEIGLEVGRQSIIDADPAANTDARVITVTVALDPASTEIAGRFTNLEVLAWFDPGVEG